MKHSKRYQTCVGIVVWVIILCMVTPLHTMISQKSTSKRIRVQQPIQSERYKNKLIWVKTSDNVRMELPQWQIDQMKAVLHKGAETQYHWVDAPMITSDELVLVQEALNVTDNFEKFRKFYADLSQAQKDSLIQSASTLEMQGLTSLLMTYTFPPDVQKNIGGVTDQVAGVIAPVVEYLKRDHKKFLSKDSFTVMSVACSPDGNYIVSGRPDGTLIVWNSRTGQRIKELKDGQDWSVRVSVAYSPDGNYIVSGSLDKSLIVWDSQTGDKIKIFEGHSNRVSCLAYSPDGKYIVSGSFDKPLIVWDSQTGDEIKIFEGHNNGASCVAYSPDGKDIVLGGYDGELMLLDSQTGDKIKIFEGHKAMVRCVAYSPDGKNIVSGAEGEDGDLILWDSQTGDKMKIFKGHSAEVNGVAYSPDGKYIVSGSLDKSVILWDSETGDKIKIFEEYGEAVICVAYSPDGKYIVAGTRTDLVLWNLIDDQTIHYIATQLNVAQARFLYRLYQAHIAQVTVILDRKDLDYQIYLTLPGNVQQVVKKFLPFELALDVAQDVTEKRVQEKMKELELSLFYHWSWWQGVYEKKYDEKIKAVENVMQQLDKSSIAYKACERLLNELKLQADFGI